MRKEVIFAIIAGVFFGLVVAFGVWRANTALNGTENTDSTTSSETPTNTPQNQELNLAISTPEEMDVITESPITLSGITRPRSWVVVSAEDEDYVLNSGEQGEFEQEIELVGGVNQIMITSFREDGSSTSTNLTVVHSSEFAEQLEGSEEEDVE